MSQHVYPLLSAIEHITDGSGCWCAPAVLKLCPECGDEPEDDPGCWQCGGVGTVPAEEGDEGPFILVHSMSDEEGAEELFLESTETGRLVGLQGID